MKLYHVRLNVADILALRQRPEYLWQLPGMHAFDQAELISVGQSLALLTLVLSAGIHPAQNHGTPSAQSTPETDLPPVGAGVADQIGARHVGHDLHQEPQHPEMQCIDPLVNALRDRGADAERVAAIDFGYGSACVLSPVAVQKLSVILRNTLSKDLRAMLDSRQYLATKTSHGVTDTLPVDAALSDFTVLQRFYGHAAAYGQYIIIVGV